jgi:2-polyprenyl-3-methyl-5-hydroxy-6-metoxy-1,4-benzoquinol methylase
VKISGGLKENGTVIGNVFNKYSSGNPVVQWITNKFDTAISDLVKEAKPESIHEVGCGEGYWVFKWHREGFLIRGSDFSSTVIKIAQENAVEQGISPELFFTRSIYDLTPEEDSADLVVCCEVLEHLEHPDKGLNVLSQIAKPYAIISVPREPIWRALNMLRGKYVTSFGNTPGHIHHWSKQKFINIVEKYFRVIKIKSPLPWTIVLCRVLQ